MSGTPNSGRNGEPRRGFAHLTLIRRRRGAAAWAVACLTVAVAGLSGGWAFTAEKTGEASKAVPPRESKSKPKPKPKLKPTAAPLSSNPAGPHATSPSSSPSPPPLPLHERIDRLIEARLARELPGQDPAAPALDAEFLRRVWLDLAGMIPTAEDARAFLDDPSGYKRRALIDRLLESPTYARRMQQFFDVYLMERRPDVYVPSAAWREFLHQAFVENRPYDVLVRQILAADGKGKDPAQRGPARFLLDREADPNVATRDVGRLFLGVDLTCCQCHDHLLIDDYKQQHYYGLYAFFSRTVLIGGRGPDGAIKPGSVAVIGEKADGEVTFSSVFKKKVSHQTGPRVIDEPPPPAAPVVPIPKGQEYVIPPDKDGAVAPSPVFSRFKLLGPSLTAKENTAFARNIVNRLWAMMMGRGIVQPLDLHHGDNPPSNPELLDLLATEFTAMNYDIKAFLRELALTRAYQRGGEPPPDSSPELAEPRHFAVAGLRPASPEQLAWSVMQGVGLVEQTRKNVEWALDGVDPRMKAILSAGPKQQALRAALVEEKVFQALVPNVATFVSYFGGVAGQPQQTAEATSTVDQALFFTNGEPIKSWLNAGAPWLVGRLNALSDPSDVAEELYLSLLSRRPSTAERAEVAEYLSSRLAKLSKDQNPGNERLAALRELAWGVLASSEFRFNH